MPDATGFTQSTWAGKPRYQCDRCAYDSTSHSAIQAHVKLAHVKLPAAQVEEATIASTTSDEEAPKASDKPKRVSSGKQEEAEK